jgi:hypothetical protein
MVIIPLIRDVHTFKIEMLFFIELWVRLFRRAKFDGAVRGINKSHALTHDKWATLIKEKNNSFASKQEIKFWIRSANALGEKGQLARQTLGNSSLSVILSARGTGMTTAE